MGWRQRLNKLIHDERGGGDTWQGYYTGGGQDLCPQFHNHNKPDLHGGGGQIGIGAIIISQLFAASVGAKTVTGAETEILSLDLGAVGYGEILSIAVLVTCQKISTAGATDLFVRQKSGDSILVFSNNRYTLWQPNTGSLPPGWGLSFNTGGQIIQEGSCVVKLTAQSFGSNLSIADGKGMLWITRFRGVGVNPE